MCNFLGGEGDYYKRLVWEIIWEKFVWEIVWETLSGRSPIQFSPIQFSPIQSPTTAPIQISHTGSEHVL